jgi:uncharacterized protein (TIGR02186 family)
VRARFHKKSYLTRQVLLLTVVLFVFFPLYARAEKLILSLSTPRVAIASNYTGTDVVVFGSIERDAQTVPRVGPYQIVLTVRGPKRSLVVRKKERLGPIWINQEQQKFTQIPSFMAVLSSWPLDQITTIALRRRLGIGIGHSLMGVDSLPDITPDQNPFLEALMRLKDENSLFTEDDRGVTFLTPQIFRSAITLPATAPTGIYTVEIRLFADNVIIAEDDIGFEVMKIGFEQQLADAARSHSLFYGLSVALMAVFFGWLANVIFRRD